MGRAADVAPLPLALPTPSRDAPEMLRSFNAEVDGLANSAEAQRYRIVQGERICGWSCDPAGPYYEQDKGLCPAQCLPGYVRPPRKRRYETIPDVCSTQPPPLPAVKGQASCSGNAASLTAAGIWMLVGVQTGPAHLGRRDGVRASWKRWENGAGVLVCFLIGRVGVTRRQLLTLDAEDKQHGDILWLENATDAGVPTVKGFHWWRAAARLLPPPGSERGVRIAAKVDDDSFLCAAPPAPAPAPAPPAPLLPRPCAWWHRHLRHPDADADPNPQPSPSALNLHPRLHHSTFSFAFIAFTRTTRPSPSPSPGTCATLRTTCSGSTAARTCTTVVWGTRAMTRPSGSSAAGRGSRGVPTTARCRTRTYYG